MKLRWTVQRNTPNARPKLQAWQPRVRTSESAGIDYAEDGEWVDVPVVMVHREVDEPMSCCDSGPQHDHANGCPNAE